ncbi:MAG TPA: hypothetical protein VKE72_03370 [Methylocella sp.]|nr:hypothetical protein [Methylocella sp.]
MADGPLSQNLRLAVQNTFLRRQNRYDNHHPGWIAEGENRLTTKIVAETANIVHPRIQSATS